MKVRAKPRAKRNRHWFRCQHCGNNSGRSRDENPRRCAGCRRCDFHYCGFGKDPYGPLVMRPLTI